MSHEALSVDDDRVYGYIYIYTYGTRDVHDVVSHDELEQKVDHGHETTPRHDCQKPLVKPAAYH